MRTEPGNASNRIANGVGTNDARTGEITALSSQVSSAFGELSRVQTELAERLQSFSEREAELERLRADLDKERDEHEAQVARAERISRQAQVHEEVLDRREAAVERREQAVQAFRDLLARMATALDDPTPTNLSAALDAATVSLRASHAALGARAQDEATVESEETGLEEAAVSDVVEDEGVDLSDFSEEELHKLGLLQKLGTATTADIAEQIRSERDGSEKKKRSWFA